MWTMQKRTQIEIIALKMIEYVFFSDGTCRNLCVNFVQPSNFWMWTSAYSLLLPYHSTGKL